MGSHAWGELLRVKHDLHSLKTSLFASIFANQLVHAIQPPQMQLAQFLDKGIKIVRLVSIKQPSPIYLQHRSTPQVTQIKKNLESQTIFFQTPHHDLATSIPG
jgi:hypothetical protein